MKYLRFIVTSDHPSTIRCTGVVASLSILSESGNLPRYHVTFAAEIFTRMNDRLPCPPFEEKGWAGNAVSWFKDSAREWIGAFRDIIAILEDSGLQVRMLTTTDPGTILYEDDFQVAARSRKYW